ncbi:MAG: hypothetical protein V4629_10440 [Pseudomonadota bacterium]
MNLDFLRRKPLFNRGKIIPIRCTTSFDHYTTSSSAAGRGQAIYSSVSFGAGWALGALVLG